MSNIRFVILIVCKVKLNKTRYSTIYKICKWLVH